MNSLFKLTRYFVLNALFSLLFLSCESIQNEDIQIVKQQNLDSISGGSGIGYAKGSYWVVGDDSPFLFRLNNEAIIVNKYKISNIPNFGQLSYEKGVKPDFEALDIFNDTILIIGSGSTEFTRDTAVLFSTNSEQIITKKSLHNLYHDFYLHGDFPIGKSINIEGLANDGAYIYFFHRGNICGNNRVYRLEKKEFLDYLSNHNSSLPAFTSYVYDLPLINKSQSGFSGAYYSKSEDAIFITLSVESTPDVYQDGEILGSFIGKIKLKNHTPGKLTFWPIMNQSELVTSKMESLCLLPKTNSETEFYTLSDNDNGKSELYQIKLK
ncbi:MAG: hypothetical protein JW729_02390 [Bacteroidales bacterium]|nr:hypothetical protein [Bacteroidales bacterium]